jgi:hypothetical protein
MATKPKSEGLVVDDPVQTADISTMPKLVIAGGRGGTGKSTLERWATERSIARGGEPTIIDADRTNPTLKAFFPQAQQPPTSDDYDVRAFLNSVIDEQNDRRGTVYIDLGGGDLTLRQWARELDLAPFLAEQGIIPVLFHVVGADLDDLAYLRDLETVFAPQHTAIVLNEGALPAGPSPAVAFEHTLNHPVLLAAVDRGAQLIRMPRLGCMRDVDRRRLLFQEAQDGAPKPGHERMGITARQTVAIWRRQMEAAFEPIQAWIT